MPLVQVDYSDLDHEDMANKIGLSSKHVPLLIASYLEEAEGGLSKLQDSINKRDYDAIKSDAHFIKGSSGNLKFVELYEMSKEVELAASEQDDSFDYDGYFKAIKEAIGTIK
jgi:HPt (histidine-containing phosphotransfer) domain-containing protein